MQGRMRDVQLCVFYTAVLGVGNLYHVGLLGIETTAYLLRLLMSNSRKM